MSEQALTDRIAAYNENGRLYRLFGTLGVIFGLLLVPLLGIVGVFCGYKLYADGHDERAGLIIAVGGLVALLLPIILFQILEVTPT